jgi:hypothetical protein
LDADAVKLGLLAEQEINDEEVLPDLKVYVGDTEPSSTATVERNTLCSYFPDRLTTAPNGQSIACDQPVTGRYIIIQRQQPSTSLVMCEVQPQVVGEPACIIDICFPIR